MFDKYEVSPQRIYTNNHSYVEVKETKAPTDESVRLLNEMQEKALSNILGNITFKDNNFFGRMEVYRNYRYDGNTYYLQFSLNGNKHKVEIQNYPWEDSSLSQVEKITKTLADYLARTMLSHLFENLSRNEKELLAK